MKKIALISFLRAISIIGQVVFVKVYTHYLTAEQLGVYYFYFTVSYFFNALIFVPYDFFQQSEIFKIKSRGSSIKPLINCNKTILALVCFFSVVLGSFFYFINYIDMISFCLIVSLSVMTYISTSIKNVLNYQGHQLLVVSTMIFEIVIKIAILYFIIMYIGFKEPDSIILSLIASMLFGLLPLYKKLNDFIKSFSDESNSISFNRVYNFCWPLSLGAILNWVQLQGYRMLMVPLGFAEMVGNYATVASVGSTGMNAAATVFQQIYMPKVYQTTGEYTKTYLKYAALVIVAIATIGYVLRDLLITMITNISFLKYASVILIGILIEAGNFIIGVLSIHLSLKEQTKEQIKAGMLGFIFVPLIFAILFYGNWVSVYTIGLPLLFSQAVIVLFLYKMAMRFNHANK